LLDPCCCLAPEHHSITRERALVFAAQESMASSSSNPNATDDMDQLVSLQRSAAAIKIRSKYFRFRIKIITKEEIKIL
jgi:hypothetical protein